MYYASNFKFFLLLNARRRRKPGPFLLRMPMVDTQHAGCRARADTNKLVECTDREKFFAVHLSNVAVLV